MRELKERKTVFIAVLLALTISVVFSGPAGAEKKEEKAKDSETPSLGTAAAPVTVSRTISGEIGVRRGGYITVIYKKDPKNDGTISKDYEMLLPIDETVTLSHIRSIEELKEGDIIEIGYEENSWIDAQGVGRIERRARQIRFISPAAEGLRSQ